ncbi:MotA/TolQ/ExbB proton channel family protein [Sedimentibacter sp. zth1]|uniref:motility protein A n=1 Tax=Sedimentibacter sp. zth1 TaxID=2816908 RepID=UPI001A925959|nr:MotA/TolQ/ExbB proton channel family protein [Sedimentibacter sp. zth1]QSX07193.1 MotA/TolQ/ExbB proton channel family protein [Sedimentibacter sp. zth1]
MDFTIIIGLIAAIGLVLYGITGNGDLNSFWNLSSVCITVGGTFAATFMSVPLKDFLKIPTHFRVAMRKNKVNLNGYIDVLVDLAQEARVKGLLALEEKVNQIEIDDDFLKFCVMLIIDALEATKVREQIENEINCIESRHSEVWKLYERAEVFAPAFGMIGTLIGLINMLSTMNPDDATSVTKGMATALITTFYGSCLANIFFAPLGNKLKSKHAEEMVVKELIMEGVLSIQAGENPKYLRDKLKSYLITKDRINTDDIEATNR